MTEIVEFNPGHCAGAVAHLSQSRYQYMLDNPATIPVLNCQTYSAIDRHNLIAIGGATLVEGKAAGRAGFVRGGALLARSGARLLDGKGKRFS